jgi:hypothetical protein
MDGPLVGVNGVDPDQTNVFDRTLSHGCKRARFEIYIVKSLIDPEFNRTDRLATYLSETKAGLNNDYPRSDS